MMHNSKKILKQFTSKRILAICIIFLCFSFSLPLFTQTAKAQSSIDVAVNNWDQNFANSVELGPNAFGQVEFKFSPSTTCTLNTIGFYGKGAIANVKIYLANDAFAWIVSGGMLAQSTATLRSDYPGYVMQWEWADFSSSNVVLTVGNTYIVSIQNNAYPPLFLFSTSTTGNTWNWTGKGGVINDLFYDVRGTPTTQQVSPTPYPTTTPYQTPTPTPYFYNPTPTPTYVPIMGYQVTPLELVLGFVICVGIVLIVFIGTSKGSKGKKKR